MWGNDSKDEAPRPTKGATTVDTLIGRQSEITGDVRFAGGLHVDGKVKGKVMADSDKNAVLSVSESGSVEGDVRVPHVVLNGSVEGDVHASQRITLSAKARVNGNVYYKLIEMTSGAMVNGQMVYEGEGADKVAPIPGSKNDPAETETSAESGAGRAAAGGDGKTTAIGSAREKV